MPPPLARPVGTQLREWRQRRRLSQSQLALDAEMSPRHLSFLETGRSAPSRSMLLRLSERLDVPLRDRNSLLLAAGFAPMFRERPLADPGLDIVRRTIDLVLRGHEPAPAIAVDRHWHIVSMNRCVGALLEGVDPTLLESPVNALRLALHPGGLAPRILNLGAWRTHLLARLEGQIAASGDPVLEALRRELVGYPAPSTPEREAAGAGHEASGIAVPLVLRTPLGVLSFVSTTTVFGSPTDVLVSELALETFFPADEATARCLSAARPADLPPTSTPPIVAR